MRAGRGSRWTNRAPLTGLVLLDSACHPGVFGVRYCAAQSDDSFIIDFGDEELVFCGAGYCDEIFPISPCTDRVKTCFLGEISFVNPFEAAVSQNANVVSAEPTGNGFGITTLGAGTQTRYVIESGERLPREFIISDEEGRNARTYVRCHRWW